MKSILFVVACFVAMGFTSCGLCNSNSSSCDSIANADSVVLDTLVSVDTVAVDTIVSAEEASKCK